MHELSSCQPTETFNAKEISWNDWWSRQCWFYFLKRAFFSLGSFVVYIWRQRSSDQDVKVRSPTMRHVSRTHRVALDWLFIESMWTPRSKSNTVTPKTYSQTLTKGHFTRDKWNHLLCLFNIVLKRCRKEHKKMQVKKESQQNQSRWWMLSRDTAWGIRTCLLRLHKKAWWKRDLKVKYLSARGMSSNQEQGDLWWALAHQITEKWNIDEK